MSRHLPRLRARQLRNRIRLASVNATGLWTSLKVLLVERVVGWARVLSTAFQQILWKSRRRDLLSIREILAPPDPSIDRQISDLTKRRRSRKPSHRPGLRPNQYRARCFP